MAANRRINSIIFLFSLIGKPLYWLILSPVLIFILARKLIRYSLQRIFLHAPKARKAETKRKTVSRSRKTNINWLPGITKAFVKWKKRSIKRGWVVLNSFKSKKSKLKLPPLWLPHFKPVLPKLPRVTIPRFRFHFKRAVLSFSQLSFMLGISIMIGSFSYGAYWFYQNILKDLPTPQDLVNYNSPLTTKIYDRNHNLLYKIYKDENRSWIPLSQISPFAIQATIATEDKEFYYHKGLSLKGIARSIKRAITEKRIQGGSTITQQLVKNTLLTHQRTIVRKLKEIILALQVETTLSKDEILEMYLNEVSYGGSAYGIEEAAQRYFRKSASELNLAEASFLAGLPASPSTFSPSGPNPESAVRRQHEVLRQMVDDEKISALQAESAKAEDLNLFPATDAILAPHFVMYVRDILAREFGEQLVSQGGLEVITSLDLNTQHEAEEIVRDELKRLAGSRVSNGAALVTNPNTGEVLAMVGSKDYFDAKNDGQVNVTLRPRQPGSSIKPLMYSAALQRGFTPATILDDSPIVYTYKGGPPYAPKNYDGQFHGKETLRVALASSHNVPAVKTENTIGLSTFINHARAMGISTWEDSSRFGLSLTLGGGEVKMVDLATAYGAFANGGKRIDLNPVLTVNDSKGKTLYQNHCALTQDCDGLSVLDERVAFQITNILSDNLARSRAFGFNSVLNIPGQQVAVKTGTTNSLRDNWTIGYTSHLLVATWVGNNDNTPMSAVVSGITGASPIWNKIMRKQLEGTRHAFTPPGPMISLLICSQTGRPVCGDCQHAYMEYFLPGTAPTASCNQNISAKQMEPKADTTTLTQWNTRDVNLEVVNQ